MFSISYSVQDCSCAPVQVVAVHCAVVDVLKVGPVDCGQASLTLEVFITGPQCWNASILCFGVIFANKKKGLP